MYIYPYVKYPLFYSEFNESWILTDFQKIVCGDSVSTTFLPADVHSCKYDLSSIHAVGKGVKLAGDAVQGESVRKRVSNLPGQW
jgi:hypothetical protein